MAVFQIETDDPCGEARKLMAAGALRVDRLQTMRDGKPCLTGLVGWFADHTVRETPTEGPHFVRWRPFPAERARALAAKRASGASTLPARHEAGLGQGEI